MSKIYKHELCFISIISALSQLDKLNLGSYEQRTEVITTLLNKFEIINTEKLQHQLEIQTKRVENLKEYVKLHLPPIFDSGCEGCRCAESASVKGLKIDQELEKELENLK